MVKNGIPRIDVFKNNSNYGRHLLFVSSEP